MPSNRFSNAPKQRNFTVKPKQKQRRTAKRSNNNRRSAFNSTSEGMLENYKVYVNSLTAAGLKIPIGPDKLTYGATSYYQRAKNFNNYRPIAVSIEYTPLLNQTTAKGMINAYLTTDIKAVIPAADADMKNSTVCHRGSDWFSSSSVKRKFKIPMLKSNAFETGGGDITTNTPYEESAYIIIKPTSADDAKLVYGEVFISIDVKFYAPAVPVFDNKIYVSSGEGFNIDVLYETSKYDAGMLKTLFKASYAKYLCPDYHDQTRAINTWYLPSTFDIAFAAIPFGERFMFTNDQRKGDQYATWTSHSKWEIQTFSTVQAVEMITPIVPSSSITTSIFNHHKELVANSIPTYNKITEDADNTKVEVQDQPILVKIDEQPILVNIQDQPVLVNVADLPLDVSVVNKELPVYVNNSELPVDIQHQPIDVHQVKNAGEQILDILGTLVSFLRVNPNALDEAAEDINVSLPTFSYDQESVADLDTENDLFHNS